MIEFEINGLKFRAGKLDVFKQLHVSRKVAPVLPKLMPVFLEFAKSAKVPAAAPDPASDATDPASADVDLAAMASAVEPLAQVLAEMSDADVEYVVNTCLSVVAINQANNWASVLAPSGVLMFDTIDLPVTVQIVAKVIQDSLGPFLSGFLAKVPSTNPTA